jgi:hypothetical protein
MQSAATRLHVYLSSISYLIYWYFSYVNDSMHLEKNYVAY